MSNENVERIWKGLRAVPSALRSSIVPMVRLRSIRFENSPRTATRRVPRGKRDSDTQIGPFCPVKVQALMKGRISMDSFHYAYRVPRCPPTFAPGRSFGLTQSIYSQVLSNEQLTEAIDGGTE